MRRRRIRDRHHFITEVNITPLVDTCLALLIMFMIATPSMVQQTIPISLPKAMAGKQASVDHRVFVTVAYDRSAGKSNYYFLQDKDPVKMSDLKELLKKKLNPSVPEQVFIYSDGQAPMEEIVSLIDVITSMGGKVSIITEHGEPGKAGGGN